VVWEAVGELLPAAAVIAGNPFVIMVAVVLLAGGKMAPGLGYLAGWVLGLSALTAIVVARASALDADEDPAWLSVLRLVVGVVLIVAGVRAWVRRPRRPEDRKSPRWMAGLESAGFARSFGIGALLAAANPKHIALVSTNASFISQVHPSLAGSILAGAVLVAIGASSIAACVLLRVFGGATGQRALSAVNRFLVEHADVLVAAVVVLIGIKIVGDGIGGLGRA
jgi:threonine/homoserine/homoserine lactone efflux protein